LVAGVACAVSGPVSDSVSSGSVVARKARAGRAARRAKTTASTVPQNVPRATPNASHPALTWVAVCAPNAAARSGTPAARAIAPPASMTARAAAPAAMLTWDTGRRVRPAVPLGVPAGVDVAVVVIFWLLAGSAGCLAW
jgi:hypothetical protein